jgi:hypothetical protein
MTTIHIASDFSTLPGPRYIAEGKHSGEDFRERVLKPQFIAALASSSKLVIDLDGVTFGYPTSFLEEAFGGLARDVGIDAVLNALEFRSSDEPMLVEEITRYIREANQTSVERNKSREVRQA